MIDEDELLLCIECAKDIRLKKLIKRINKKGLCSCCENNEFIIDVDSNEFIQIIKALIRYHYSEWDYNEHWGGNGYGSLFYKSDNIFLNKGNFKDEDVYDELINRIECLEVYEDYDKGVSIFAGYDDGQQNPLLQSIKSDLDYSIKEIEYKLKSENYFKFEDQITQMLSEYSDCSKIKVKKKSEFYRARIGVENKKRSLFEGGFEGDLIFVPYSNSQIGAPPPLIAGIGRLNRAGVSYLYSATDKYTAISEIRPHPGDVVSIGKFIVNKELLIFDLTESQFLNFFQSDESLDKFGKLNTFTELMQKVIPPLERHAYNITQLIADCIRKLNFDGILFPSSVGNGENLVVFNPELMSYTYDEAEVVEIRDVSYEYFQRKWKKDISEIE
ncbi:RES family NAD+ phosphorylase [Flavobacterium sp. 1355]|uniref:RES family NAD+ phosphorylase n=1 Tax=Flavobacterium sp. 1355 TaxID=2806571 RepID=UPI001AE641E1|nr:RES family NAD+ phosphorylase [Flavobacterium sp. 1355]MBP1222337.1 RES domain-containing protein [Flavobacterium sp. 1355]